MSRVDEPIIIYSAFGSLENAKEVAHRIIEARLGACVNLFPKGISIFQWEGALCEQEEVLMFVKTICSKEAELIELITKYHIYEEPGIITLPIVGGAASYLAWASEQVK